MAHNRIDEWNWCRHDMKARQNKVKQPSVETFHLIVIYGKYTYKLYQPRAKAFNGLPPPDDAAETSLPEAKERRAARAAPRLRAIADTRNIIVKHNYKCLISYFRERANNNVGLHRRR